MAMQSPSSSSSISYAFTYQVFLSFRGTDTHLGFTGNLYTALTNKGIHTFIDDCELQAGDEITPSLLKAIEESRIFIHVFSINYASSSFCLDELVHIIHCYKTKGRLVLPVFFGVEPTNVRHHKGSFGEALAEYEKRFQNDKNNMERLQRWKVALSQAANLSGYHDSPPRYEYKLIGEIVKYISNKISRQPLHVANYPVGLQSRVQQVKSLLDERSDDGVHMKFQDMKVLILDDCEYLTHIPDVSGLSNLEKLSFENCDNLITIHNSVGHLNKLERLSAYGCTKLKHFPPLGLASLKELNLSGCESLDSFPKLLCKMTNIDNIWLIHTSIRELPFSFQNLSELRVLQMFIVRMLRFPKHNDKMYSIVFSNVTQLTLEECNLSDECLPIFLKWCVNMTSLHLSYNNFKILPECLSECHHLVEISVRYCKSLEEIRGIPPNLKELSAEYCESLSSSSKRMLMSQKLHQARCTKITFPNGSEGIPDWFEHQSRGDTISFWFRKEIPSITCIFILPEGYKYCTSVDVCLNGYEIEIDHWYRFWYVIWNHTTLFRTPKLNELIKTQCEYNIEPPLKKQRLVEVGVSETEEDINASLQQQELMKEEQRKTWGTFLSLGASKSNTDENVVFSSAQDERKTWGTFLGLGPL